MKTSESIGHEGVVERIVNNAAFVSFSHTSGCSGCSVKSSCGMAESTDKIFKIPLKETQVREGDRVIINISMRDGYRAVVLGYLLPFAVVLMTLTAALVLGVSEPVAGIISLAILIPYFILLKLFRNLFKNDLSIEVQKR